MVISARRTGHPPSITDTRIAHASPNRACPHVTSEKPARGATKHTSQQSSEVVAAAAVADSDAPEAGTGACLSLSSLLLLLLLSSSRGCRDAVLAPTGFNSLIVQHVRFSRALAPLFDLVSRFPARDVQPCYST